jgi:uncharacterized protein (DUF3820 family)
MEHDGPLDDSTDNRIAPADLRGLEGSMDAELLELANAKMPFGKYAGQYLVDLPENYVLWFKVKGYPEGKLGEELRAIEEIKVNGLEYLLRPLVGMKPAR